MPARVDFANLTLMDTLDLATLIEIEAYKRYSLFAEQLGSSLTEDAGSVFQSMAINEKKHGDELAERRFKLYGETPPRVKLSDVYDVEAPDVGAPRWGMSVQKAYWVALASEQKAHAFYDGALRSVTDPEVRALFEELRDEEAEHVRMIEVLLAKLPPEAKQDVESEDDTDSRMGY